MATLPQTFLGYRRADGTVGIRNHLAVIPSVVCANTVAQRVAALIPGAVAIPHPHGCAQVGDDVGLTERVLAGAAANPNVGAALIIGLGCETCQSTDVADLARGLAPGRPVQSFSIQDAGGSIKAIARGVEAGKALLAQVAAQQRQPAPLVELVLATKCGDLDASSATAANPTLGVLSDMLIDAGGSVLLAETPDLVGAALALARRARDAGVAQRLRQIVEKTERAEQAARAGGTGGAADAADGPAELVASGEYTPEAASLACIAKAGGAPVQDVLRFAERPRGRGLFVMDTPVHDAVAVSAMAAGGAQVCLFTTGRGSPMGNAIVPVIKVCANPATNRRLEDNIDFSAAPIGEGQASPEALAPHLLQLLVDVCSGRLTNAEIIGHQEFAIHRIGPTV